MAKKPGVGYQVPPGSRAVWVGSQGKLDDVPINLAATRFEERYGHPSAFGSAQGMVKENFGNNAKALLNWYAAQPAAHREQWDGIPTGALNQLTAPAGEWEQWDLAFTESQTSSPFYRTFWLAFEPGGTKETAIVVDESTWPEHGAKFPRGVALGLQTKPNPIEGLVNWYDVRWKPPGFPDPAPPPTIGAAAEFWSASGFVPGKVKSVRGTKVRFTPDAGGASAEHDLDDERRRWWLKDAPAPVPSPPPPTPAPPAPTPKPPAPKPEPIPLPAVPAPFSDEAMRTFDLAPTWPELEGKRGRIARLSRLAREAQRIQAALLAARGE